MKIISLSVILLIFLFIPSNLDAQVGVSIKINIGTQPVWGPTGYDYVEYYYLPDIHVFYHVPTHRYYYFYRGRWRNSSALPRQYRHYDFYKSYKVVVNERNPWLKANFYKEKYSSYKGRHDQQIIRESREEKYFVNKNHPEHKNWLNRQRHNKREGHRDQGKGGDTRERGRR